MKKILVLITMLTMPCGSKADLITTTLLDNVMTVTQFKSGETKLALVDSIVLIGSYKGKSILDLQAGFNSETKPEPGEASGANLIAGAFFKVSTLLSSTIDFPKHWEFLNSLEHGPFYSYDFREKRDYVGYQVGFSFDLRPL